VRVLVVAGDPQTAELLAQDGHLATLTTDAEKTVQMSTSFDAVVVDSTFPTGRALALCRALHARGDLPVVVLIEESSADARVRALEAGADDCLSVPLLVDELEARLRAIVRRFSSAAFSTDGGA
jgi:DNA-binding response OmpR family regulator